MTKTLERIQAQQAVLVDYIGKLRDAGVLGTQDYLTLYAPLFLIKEALEEVALAE